MKRMIAFLLLLPLAAAGGHAADKSEAVAMKSRNFSLSFFLQPVQADSRALPLIQAVAAGKEKFGVELGTVPGSSPVLEILGSQGAVLRALSVNDLLGKGASKETRLLPAVRPRRAEAVYTVRLQEQDARVIVRSLVTGDDGSPDQRLVVSFALKVERPAQGLALRLKLPATGTLEETPGGFMILSRSGNAALAASVLPAGAAASVQKGRLTLLSAPRSLQASDEAPMLWLVISGVGPSSNARAEAARLARENHAAGSEPRVTVVSAADRDNLSQADTASYTLICMNVGSGEATDVVLSNPIPKGTRYVPGSATRSGMELREETAGAAVTGLKWIVGQPLRPGEEKVVTFRVTVQ